MKKTRNILLIVFVLPALVSCNVSCNQQGCGGNDTSICIVSWNVQNLFNAVNDGSEYDEYKPESGWDQQSYEKRLSNIRTVFGYLPSSKQKIIVLNEVEGPDVIEDLIKSHDMASIGFHWFACTSSENQSVQTAVISSMPIEHAYVHEVEEGLRPVLEVCIETERGKIFILAVHYKSNLGGSEETEAQRQKAAGVTAQIARVLEQENPGCLILVCGDMNEECWDNRIMGPDGPLKASGSFSPGFWYCFWKDQERSIWPNGSYWYSGNWRCYDNILVSASGSDGAGLELESCGVIFKGILSTADSKPASWNRRLLTGVSDHVPVWIMLK